MNRLACVCVYIYIYICYVGMVRESEVEILTRVLYVLHGFRTSGYPGPIVETITK